MLRKKAAGIGALLAALAPVATATSPAPPRPELQGLRAVYLDVRVRTAEEGSPAIYPALAIERPLADRAAALLSKAKVALSRSPHQAVPQLRVWVNIARNTAMADAAAVGVSVAFSDAVSLLRLPDVHPTYQGVLWDASEVRLVPSREVDSFILHSALKLVQSFLQDVEANASPNDRQSER